MRMRCWLILLFLCGLLMGCTGTRAACPQNTESPRPTLDLETLKASSPTPGPVTPVLVKIGGKEMQVDMLVSGPVCNDRWQGTVYVSCEAQVAPWEELPLFFEQCDLEIEPGTVVYVGAHNDTAYYQGCSCHTGEVETSP